MAPLQGPQLRAGARLALQLPLQSLGVRAELLCVVLLLPQPPCQSADFMRFMPLTRAHVRSLSISLFRI